MRSVIDVSSSDYPFMTYQARRCLPFAFAVGILLLASSIALAADGPLVASEGGPWSAGIGFKFDVKPNKTRRAVSGIACSLNTSSSRTCLFAFDEGVEARFAELGNGGLTPQDERVALLAGGGELDAEGAALDGDMFYVTGSHSAKRGDCKSNPDSRHVVRFRQDPATGGAARLGNGQLSGYAETGALWPLMAKQPELSAFVGDQKCLGTEPPEEKPKLAGQRGVNIEAIAARGGRLFFGFRGPALDGRAPVLAVDAAGLFEGAPTNEIVSMVQVGLGRGIRDMQSVKDGILVLTGPDDDKANASAGWTLRLWDGVTTPDGIAQARELARLNLDNIMRDQCDEEVKPEALTVLEDAPAYYRVLVLSDGMCDGGPVLFKIQR